MVITDLGPRPVARVAPITTLDGVPGVAEMAVHLTLEPGPQHPFGQITQQATRAGQLHPLGLGAIDELLGEVAVGHVRQAAGEKCVVEQTKYDGRGEAVELLPVSSSS